VPNGVILKQRPDARLLDQVHREVFIDAMHVKSSEGQVANRPIYVSMGSPSTVSATSWACGPEGGEGAGSFLQ
jgi:hypothetical protein